MQKHLLSTLLLFFVTLVNGQDDSTNYFTAESFPSVKEWKGECCDENGTYHVPSIYETFYAVKKFKNKIPIEIHFRAIQLGNETISLNVDYIDKISGSTKLIKLNDTIAAKFTIGKVTEDEINKYIYKSNFYKHDKITNCWRPFTISSNYSVVYAKTMSLNKTSIGYPENTNYFEVIEAWIKFD